MLILTLTFAGLLLSAHCKAFDGSGYPSSGDFDMSNIDMSSFSDYNAAQKKVQDMIDGSRYPSSGDFDMSSIDVSSYSDYDAAQKKVNEMIDNMGKSGGISDSEAAWKKSQDQAREQAQDMIDDTSSSTAAAGSLAPMVPLLFFTLLARLV